MTSEIRGDEAHSLLFLSCDIVDSTQMKQNNTHWRAAFLDFYFGFPKHLQKAKGENNEIEFNLWKPVGDELIFTVKVRHERHVNDAVRIWLATMDVCSRSIDGSLRFNVKGGAFIATFPSPDSESSIPRHPSGEVSFDVYDANARALKDKDSEDGRSSYMYDYFGPSIDTGFRVLSKSSQRFFTISIEVAWALAKSQIAEENSWDDVCFLGEEILKGVWNNRPYPLFAIDTQHHDEINKAISKIARTKASPKKVLRVAESCLKIEKWPSALYLPDSDDPLVIKRPKEPPRGNLITLDGMEAQPTGDEGDVHLEASPPLDFS